MNDDNCSYYRIRETTLDFSDYKCGGKGHNAVIAVYKLLRNPTLNTAS